jgi:hypothetical protein
MITLTESQSAAIANATRPLAPVEREQFLAELHRELTNHNESAMARWHGCCGICRGAISNRRRWRKSMSGPGMHQGRYRQRGHRVRFLSGL